MAQTLRAPYRTGMVLGMGFNSYTQSTCLNRAVTIKTTSPAAEKNNIPQEVKYTRVFVDKLSDVAENLNIAGSVEIKYGPISGSGAGSYVDASKFSESDVNFLIKVHVINQHSVTDERDEKFNLLSNVTPGNFNTIYGDTYISEMEEGGIFQAVVSMKITDSSSKTTIRANASVAFSGMEGGGLNAKGDVEKAKESLNKSTEITIFAHWAGGGQVKEAGAQWSIDELIAVGGRFPQLCAQSPQTSFVILKKYIHLASFQDQVKEISPLSYENASIYTNLLMDNFIDYKQTLKDIGMVIEGLRKKTIEFDPTADPSEVDDAFRSSITGMLDARVDLLVQTSAISKLVDDIAANPDIIRTFNARNPAPYTDSVRWKLRLPATRPVATRPPVIPTPVNPTPVTPTPVTPTPATPLDPNITIRGRPAVLPGDQHQIFAQGADGFLWYKISQPGQASPSSAGTWTYHGDNIPLSSDCSPVVAFAGGGDKLRKYCFVIGADAKLYAKSCGPDDKWTPLQELGAARGIKFKGGIAASGRSDRIDICIIGIDAAMYWAFVQADGPWSPMTRLNGAFLFGTPALAQNGANGSLNLVAINLDFQVAANILSANSNTWSGWEACAGSYALGAGLSICWTPPVDPNFATQMDVMTLGEPRSNVYQLQLHNGRWRAEVGNFGKNFMRSTVSMVALGTGRQELFGIADQGALWQDTWHRALGIEVATSWRKIADGPFRSTQPVITGLSNGEMVLYVVDMQGKLVRLVSKMSTFGGAELV